MAQPHDSQCTSSIETQRSDEQRRFHATHSASNGQFDAAIPQVASKPFPKACDPTFGLAIGTKPCRTHLKNTTTFLMVTTFILD